MAIKNTWSIQRIERAKDTGLVALIEYRVEAADDVKKDAAYEQASIHLADAPESPVAFEDITNDLAIKWVKDTLDARNAKGEEFGPSSKGIEDALLNSLAVQREHTPNIAYGNPWS
tara:strand:+ start:1905 stop:2252 length:348 start_codon:yes stop_codon:yes gene_type:complete